jgi:hypothetical protein
MVTIIGAKEEDDDDDNDIVFSLAIETADF